jgi:hypothetical protein
LLTARRFYSPRTNSALKGPALSKRLARVEGPNY